MTAAGLALVTRPRENAGRIARALQERGYEVLVEPMLEITIQTGTPLRLEGVQGYLATSVNGVRALAANGAPRALPLWAVGNATAEMAGELGFSDRRSADGDVRALAALVSGAARPEDGVLLHACAREVAGRLDELLARAGFAVRRQMLYEARATAALTPRLRALLAGCQIDVALFFSPRSGQRFATLAQKDGVADGCRVIRAFALSRAVAESVAGLEWRSLSHPARARQDALLDLIDAEAAGDEEGGNR